MSNMQTSLMYIKDLNTEYVTIKDAEEVESNGSKGPVDTKRVRKRKL